MAADRPPVLRPPTAGPGADLPRGGDAAAIVRMEASSLDRPDCFAHQSERQFARLLDFYGVAWQYEPTEFALEADEQGRPVRAFRPDFYLPAYGTYIEITTLNQRLVTRKNRKVRLLRQLHPELEIKVLYQRDYLNLLVKFGLEDEGCLERAGAGDRVAPAAVTGLDGAA